MTAIMPIIMTHFRTFLKRKPRINPMINGIAMRAMVGIPPMLPDMRPINSLIKSKGKIIMLKVHLASKLKLEVVNELAVMVLMFCPFSVFVCKTINAKSGLHIFGEINGESS